MLYKTVLNKLAHLTRQSFILYEHTAYRINLNMWFKIVLKWLLTQNKQNMQNQAQSLTFQIHNTAPFIRGSQ